MKNWKRTRILSLSTMFMALAVLAALSSARALSIALVLIILASWLLSVRAEKRQNEDRTEWLIDQQQRSFIRTLNHHRHDWLNDLQLLFGYVRLKKYDKLVDTVEKIKDKMARESMIAKLGYTPLSLFLLAFRTQPGHHFQLNVEVSGEVNLLALPFNPNLVYVAIEELVRCFQQTAKPSYHEANQLNLSLQMNEERLLIRLEYIGEYSPDELRKQLETTIKIQENRETSLKHEMKFGDKQVELNVIFDI
jgi:stage 0 sporulation protein B (sporulation initiation phosphotransferase)